MPTMRFILAFAASTRLLVLALAVASPTVATAGVVLTYTGTPFTYFFPSPNSYTTSMYMTATIDLSSALPASSDVIFSLGGAGYPTLFTLGDGIQTWTPSNTGNNYFEFVTNASGNIIGWDVNIERVLGSNAWSSLQGPNSLFTTNVAQDSANLPNGNEAWNTGSAGVWTETAIPEPSSSWLMGSALLGLALVRLARVARATRSI